MLVVAAAVLVVLVISAVVRVVVVLLIAAVVVVVIVGMTGVGTVGQICKLDREHSLHSIWRHMSLRLSR